MRREKNEQTPLVTMRVLGNGRFINGVSSNIFQSMVIAGMLFILPLYLQSAADDTSNGGLWYWHGFVDGPFGQSHSF